MPHGSCLFQIKFGHFDERYVLSSRVRTGRSIRGLSLPPACTRAERREVEKVTVEALNGLTGDLSGRYYRLSEMTEKEQQQLIDVSQCSSWTANPEPMKQDPFPGVAPLGGHILPSQSHCPMGPGPLPSEAAPWCRECSCAAQPSHAREDGAH